MTPQAETRVNTGQLHQTERSVTQLLQLAQRRRRVATAVKQRIDVFHNLAQLAQLRQATGDVQELFAFRSCQVMLDEQKAILEQVTDFLLDRFALTC